MRNLTLNGSRAAVLLAATLLTSGCVNVASLDCDDIADQAKQISANQPIQIRNITGSQEISRGENDARCTAQAELSDGRSTTLYLRAYDDNGNTMVAYQEEAFQ